MIRIAIVMISRNTATSRKEKIISFFSGKSVTISIDTYFSGSELLRCGVCYDLLIMDIAWAMKMEWTLRKKILLRDTCRVILLSLHNEELPERI